MNTATKTNLNTEPLMDDPKVTEALRRMAEAGYKVTESKNRDRAHAGWAQLPNQNDAHDKRVVTFRSTWGGRVAVSTDHVYRDGGRSHCGGTQLKSVATMVRQATQFLGEVA